MISCILYYIIASCFRQISRCLWCAESDWTLLTTDSDQVLLLESACIQSNDWELHLQITWFSNWPYRFHAVLLAFCCASHYWHLVTQYRRSASRFRWFVVRPHWRQCGEVQLRELRPTWPSGLHGPQRGLLPHDIRTLAILVTSWYIHLSYCANISIRMDFVFKPMSSYPWTQLGLLATGFFANLTITTSLTFWTAIG